MEIRVSRLDVFPKDFVGHVLFKRARDGSVAGVALDHGIIIGADTIEEAQRMMGQAIEHWVERCITKNKLDELFHRSPQSLWDELDQGERLGVYDVVNRPPKGPVMSPLWPMYQARVEFFGTPRR
ncbi:MAG: hypothetical protein HY814_05905 [Candidatus Riflebacteria bacterium]|nr:hypothetical protein [Candidatus Riflebacteria bacterium]